MRAEIITIGDEILIGQIVDTNSAWMAQQLNLIGISIKQITSISDDRQHILDALKQAESRADIILITGGLGPTKDDVTKISMAEYFNMGFRRDQATLGIVEEIFNRQKRPVLDINKKQADVPDGCKVILNKNGTAPCMWFEKNNKVFVSMPGVPFEMKILMEEEVLPQLKRKFSLPFIYHKNLLTAGIGESFLAKEIEDIEDALPKHIKLAYLPKLGQVRLRLSASGQNEQKVIEEVEHVFESLKERIKSYLVTDKDIPMEKAILDRMEKSGLTLSTAESCTGGYIAHLFTQHAGSSAVYCGGGVTYTNTLKQSIVGVKPETLEQYGAVSEYTVREMAEGALKHFNTDYAMAVTGVAGPGGGTEQTPVGMVWIAVANRNNTIVKCLNISARRVQVIERSATAVLNLLLNLLKETEQKE